MSPEGTAATFSRSLSSLAFSGFFRLLEGLDHGIEIRIQHYRSPPQWLQGRLTRKQLTSVKLDREVGIFERVSCKHQHNVFFCLHEAPLEQLFQSSQGHSRRGFAANAFGTDLCLGLCDLRFTH